MEKLYKVYCFHCAARYDQAGDKYPPCCGLCGSSHIGVWTPKNVWEYPCLAVVHGCGSECTAPSQLLDGCERCQAIPFMRKPLDVSAGPNWERRNDSPRD